MGAAFVANFWYVRRKNMDPKNVQYTMLATSLRWIALCSIGLLGLQFVILPIYLSALGMAGSSAATTSIGLIGQQQGLIFGLRLVLLFVGAGLLAVFLYAMASSESKLRVAQQSGVPRVRAGADLGGPEPLSVLCQYGAHWCLASATSSEEG